MCTTIDQEDQRELQTLVEEAVHPHTEKEATTSTNGSGKGGLNGHVTIGTNNHHHHQTTTSKEESVILVADTKIIHYSNNSEDRVKYASNEYLESEV